MDDERDVEKFALSFSGKFTPRVCLFSSGCAAGSEWEDFVCDNGAEWKGK